MRLSVIPSYVFEWNMSKELAPLALSDFVHMAIYVRVQDRCYTVWRGGQVYVILH